MGAFPSTSLGVTDLSQLISNILNLGFNQEVAGSYPQICWVYWVYFENYLVKAEIREYIIRYLIVPKHIKHHYRTEQLKKLGNVLILPRPFAPL